ncbi:MAG: hypothetical protein M3067_00360 [Chloroflexota bacterium]|nr:hypothetical protein [Chloroflexota bacterium]
METSRSATTPALTLSALKDSGDPLVIAGTWTTPQADQEHQFWAAQADGSLIVEISRRLRGRA